MAFVVLSLVATAIFRLFAGALGNAGAAEEYSRATVVAQSVLAEVLAGELKEGVQAGRTEDGRVQWTAEISSYEAADVNADVQRASESLPIRMYRVVTTVTFTGHNGTERKLALSTIRVGARDKL